MYSQARDAALRHLVRDVFDAPATTGLPRAG